MGNCCTTENKAKFEVSTIDSQMLTFMSNTDILEMANKFLQEDVLSDSRWFMDIYLKAIDDGELKFGYELVPVRKKLVGPY